MVHVKIVSLMLDNKEMKESNVVQIHVMKGKNYLMMELVSTVMIGLEQMKS